MPMDVNVLTTPPVHATADDTRRRAALAVTRIGLRLGADRAETLQVLQSLGLDDAAAIQSEPDVSSDVRADNPAHRTDRAGRRGGTAVSRSDRAGVDRRPADRAGTDTVAVEFVDELPGPEGRYRVLHEYAEALRAAPGRWAKYPHTLANPAGIAKKIREGNVRAFGPGFEAEARNKVLYVRHIGDAHLHYTGHASEAVTG